MDEPTIPSSIADINASWMAAAVGQPITGVNHEQIGEGVGVSSAVYRSTLEGGDLDSVVVKLPALAEEAVFTSTPTRLTQVSTTWSRRSLSRVWFTSC